MPIEHKPQTSKPTIAQRLNPTRYSKPQTARNKSNRWGRLVRTVLVLVAMAMMASSCAGGSDGAAAELETLRADSAAEIADIQDQAADELAAASSQVEALEATVAEQADTIVELTDTVDQAAVELASQVDETERVESQLSRTNRELASAERRADDAEEQVDELLIRYDAEIRVDAQAAWDTEVTEACTDAGDGTLTIRNYVDHTDQLAIIGTEAELIALVTDCAEPLRNRSIEERLSAECEQGSADQVTKDPDALAGNCYIMYVVPWQWDSRTGQCNFLGSWDGSNLGTRSYKYDGDGIFRAPPEVCESDLDEADQDDLLKVWVTLNGAYRYDTAAGGTNEIPDFVIRKATLITKA